MAREHEGRAWQAWHTAALPRAKRFPRLNELFPPKLNRQQTPEQIEAVVRSMFPTRRSGKTS